MKRYTNWDGLQNQSADYLRINGTPNVVAESAERHGLITQRTGTARYRRNYYGVLAAISLSKLYDRGREVAVFASHPPGDVKYRVDLMESIIAEWEVETG